MIDNSVFTDWIVAFDAIEDDCYYDAEDWDHLYLYNEHYDGDREEETLLEMEFGEVLTNII